MTISSIVNVRSVLISFNLENLRSPLATDTKEGRAVATWKHGRLTIWKPGFDPRPGVLFSCEVERFNCCTLRLANPTSLGGKETACLSVDSSSEHDTPPREPFPVRFHKTTRT